MDILRLARSEGHRMTAGLLPKLTVLALVMIPLFYGAVYLYANWDPYSNMQGIKAGIVNLDEGASTDEKQLEVGDKVTEQLIEDGTFGWARQDTVEAATAKVNSGELSFALAIPEDFSASLASPQDFAQAKKAQLTFITNDANNYFLSSIVNQLAQEIHGTVAREAGKEVADAMLTGFGRIHMNLADASSGAQELAKGNKELYSGAKKLDNGAKELANGIDSADEGAEKLADGATELSTGASKLSSGLGELNKKTKELPAQTKQLADGATSLHQGLKTLTEGAEKVAAGNKKVSSTFDEGVKTFDKDVAVVKKATKSAKDALDKLPADNSEARTPSLSLEKIQLPTSDAASKTLESLVKAEVLTAEQAATIQQELVSAATGSAKEELEKAANQQLAKIWDERPQLPDGSTVSAALDDVDEKIDAVTGKLHDAQKDINTLAAGASSVATGAAEAQAGAKKLADGTSALAKATPELRKGIVAAHDGAKSLASGASTLETGADDLSTGLGKLSTGGHDLKDGTKEARDGAKKLQDGSAELSTGLTDGLREIPNLKDDEKDRVSTVIADPVNVDKLEETRAASYGAGLAPFFVPLALWIGAFILVQIMRTMSWRTLAANLPAPKVALANWVPFFTVSLAQTVLLYTTVNFGLGLDAAHPIGGFLLLALAAMAFTALIHGFVALLGNPGKFVVLILLVLQLVTAGGTMPWQTLPAPLVWAHNVLPMSHVVTGLRALFYGGDLGQLPQVIATLIGYTLLGWLLSTVAASKYRNWSVRRLQPELVE
ncbi:YhgE/Pip domain-containing protein [Micrococcoides hystricis]|uniref:YhgE/Pip family protein n=1 Tax=Micrococcoides hystricis TaxID=1572761 RepID=A0ABV6PAI5_9MICC